MKVKSITGIISIYFVGKSPVQADAGDPKRTKIASHVIEGAPSWIVSLTIP